MAETKGLTKHDLSDLAKRHLNRATAIEARVNGASCDPAMTEREKKDWIGKALEYRKLTLDAIKMHATYVSDDQEESEAELEAASAVLDLFGFESVVAD